jgi:predicted transposase YbfD/YdcC
LTDALEAPLDLRQAFQDLPDPRFERNKRHSLEDILILTVCALFCDANTWIDIETFGHAKHDWLKTFLALPNGMPSHDTLGRALARLGPDHFRDAFIRWVQSVAQVTDGEVVAIDGKTLRRSYDRADATSTLHRVSAWANANGLVLGQRQTDAKSNEITAIPELLDLLALDGCIVTLNAMGCQKDIAGKIQQQGADYVLALKGNQGQLYDDIKLLFDTGVHNGFGDRSMDTHETRDGDHGRIETRRYYTTAVPDGLPDAAQWPGLRSVGMVECSREIDGEQTTERRYYLSSLAPDAQQLGAATRQHWGIENQLHWSLDVAFREDDNRVRKDHGPDNMAMLRQLTLNLLRQETTCKNGIQVKRHKAGWDENYLFKVLALAA